MGMVTETTAAGDVRLRIVVKRQVWDRVQAVASAMGVEDREVLLTAIGLGVRYLDAIANPREANSAVRELEMVARR